MDVILLAISKEQIRHVANLARIHLEDADVERLQEDMSHILNMAGQIVDLDTEGVAPTTHAIAIENAFREDERRPSCPRNIILKNASAHDEEAFLVPQVVE